MAHQRDPTSPAASQITTASNRITVLTDGLIRLESSSDGTFEDQASTFATFRALDTPSYKLIKKDNGALEIATARFHLVWDGKPFSPSGLSVLLRCELSVGESPLKKGEGDSQHSSTWRYGQKMSNLGGTIRTLDEVDGRCDLGSGIISQVSRYPMYNAKEKYGFSVLDDSESMLFTEDGWVAPRVEGRTDVYLFAYGLDYRAALKAFHIVSGKIPLIPRWALGNWWSRYCEL
jgi:alpha-glucosidase (family GH31 glycosyl hydrolase)